MNAPNAGNTQRDPSLTKQRRRKRCARVDTLATGCRWPHSSPGARPAKVYAVTRAGRRQLQLETANWIKLSTAINGILESV